MERKLSRDEVREWLRLSKAPKKRADSHRFTMLRRMPWPYCARCGLVALRNEPTRKAMKVCEYYDD